MNASVVKSVRIDMPARIELPALVEPGIDWRRWASRGFSAVLLGVVIAQLAATDPQALRAALPATPWFWLAFAALYFALPIADWIIFRKLWRLPVAGFPMLLRKRISNELLLAYAGEVQFYLWARERAKLVAAPFGAIKDVNILSAGAANVLTLALMAVAWPFLAGFGAGKYAVPAYLSVAAMLALSLLVFAFRKRIFTLATKDLLWIAGVHFARLIVTTALVALVWHLALPGAPIGLWLMLATLRLVVGRLPLLPSKELLFATIAIFLIGQGSAVAALLALTAALTTAVHVLLGGLLAVADLIERRAQ